VRGTERLRGARSHDCHSAESAFARIALVLKARADLLFFSSRPSNLAPWVRRGGDPRSHTSLHNAYAKSLHQCSADAQANRFSLQQNRLVQTGLVNGLMKPPSRKAREAIFHPECPAQSSTRIRYSLVQGKRNINRLSDTSTETTGEPRRVLLENPSISTAKGKKNITEAADSSSMTTGSCYGLFSDLHCALGFMIGALYPERSNVSLGSTHTTLSWCPCYTLGISMLVPY
jgi:hypothetical protein